MKKGIGWMIILGLCAAMAGGGIAEATQEAADLADAEPIYAMVFGMVFEESTLRNPTTGEPIAEVEDLERYVMVGTFDRPNRQCIVRIPDAYGSADELRGKGVRLWLDAPIVEGLRSPDAAYDALLTPRAIEIAGEVCYGAVEWFDSDEIHFAYTGNAENGGGGTLRLLITEDSIIPDIPIVGQTYDVLYDAENALLGMRISNG